MAAAKNSIFFFTANQVSFSNMQPQTTSWQYYYVYFCWHNTNNLGLSITYLIEIRFKFENFTDIYKYFKWTEWIRWHCRSLISSKDIKLRVPLESGIVIFWNSGIRDFFPFVYIESNDEVAITDTKNDVFSN